MIKTFFLAAILTVAYAAPLVTTRAGTSAVMMNKTQPKSDSNGCCYKENGVCCPAGNPCEQAGLPCGTSCCEVGITGKAADEDPKGILSAETLGVRKAHASPTEVVDISSSAAARKVDATCEWVPDTWNPSTGTYTRRACSAGAFNRALFNVEWQSVDNDAIKVSYGYCSSSNDCTSTGYRGSACTWQSERSSSNNLPQTISSTVTNNPNYVNYYGCIHFKCDNWLYNCQVLRGHFSIQGTNAIAGANAAVTSAKAVSTESVNASVPVPESPSIMTDEAQLRALLNAMKASSVSMAAGNVSGLPIEMQADALELRKYTKSMIQHINARESGLSCSLCETAVGYGCGSACQHAICAAVPVACPFAWPICWAIDDFGCNPRAVCEFVGFC